MQIVLILLAWAIRMLVLLIVELGFIHRVLLENHYREWAATFASRETTLPSSNLSKPFTIQYKPQWILVPILLLRAMLVVVSFEA